MNLKLSILIFLLFTFAFVNAQTLEEVKQHIYYQRYETAKNTLQSVIKKGLDAPDAWYWLGEIYLKEKKLILQERCFWMALPIFFPTIYPKNNSL